MSSTPSTIRLQGGITSGSNVALATIINGQLYVLVNDPTLGVVMRQAFDSNCNLVAGIANTAINFTVTNRGESLIFTTGNQVLNYGTSGVLTLTNPPSRDIFFDQSQFEQVRFGSILTSGIQYIPYGDAALGEELSVNVEGMSAPQKQLLIPVPLQFFINTNGNVCERVQTDLATALRLIQCSYSSTSMCCNNLPTAWTDQQDCLNNTQFQYCTAGTFCTGNCQSVCQVQTEACIFDGSTFSCQSICPEPITPVTPTTSTPIITSTANNNNNTSIFDNAGIIFAIIFFIIIILALLFYAFYYSTPTTHVHDDHTQSVSYHNDGFLDGFLRNPNVYG